MLEGSREKRKPFFTLMSGPRRVDLLLEGEPSVPEFVCRPCVPGHIDEICPGNVFFYVKVQACDSKDIINTEQRDSVICLLVNK